MTNSETKKWWHDKCKEWCEDIEASRNLHKIYPVVMFCHSNETRDAGYVYNCFKCGMEVSDDDYGRDYTKYIDEKFIPCPVNDNPKSGHGNFADIVHVMLN